MMCRADKVEVAAARLFAGYMSGNDTDDDLRDPLVREMIGHALGERDLKTKSGRDAWALYLAMVCSGEGTITDGIPTPR